MLLASTSRHPGPEDKCSVLRVGDRIREELDQRMHGVLRNEVGHMRRQRSARGVDLHALAQPAAVLSHKAIVDDLFVQGDLIDLVVGGSYVSTIFHSSVDRERANHVVAGVCRHADAVSKLWHRTGTPYSARVPLPDVQRNVPLAVLCPGNVPLAVVCNETQFHASVGHFWEEAPEGHVHVSGKDAAAASAAFRQAVVETLAWFAVFFGMIVVQVEDSDERLHAIEDGLVPLHLHRQDATPSAL